MKRKAKKIPITKDPFTIFALAVIAVIVIALVQMLVLKEKYDLTIKGYKSVRETRFWEKEYEQAQKYPPTPPENCACIAFFTPTRKVAVKQLSNKAECKAEAEKLRQAGNLIIKFLQSCPRTVEEFKQHHSTTTTSFGACRLHSEENQKTNNETITNQ